jgi:uncharacterized protein YkuJ
MPNWTDLPTEIKQMIVNEVDLEDYDLLDLRLTNVENNLLSKKRFTERYFTVRKVFICEKSLQILVDISKDPFFGPCVKTVLLSALHGDYETPNTHGNELPEYRRKYLWYHITCFDDEPQELKPLLTEAFRNLKTYGAPIEIGLTRWWGPEEEDNWGYNQGVLGWLWKEEDGSGYTVRNAKWADFAKNERDTFNMLTSAADESALPVKALDISLLDHYEHYIVDLEHSGWNSEQYKEPCNIHLVEDIYNYLADCDDMDVNIEISVGEYRREGYKIMKVNYNKEAKSLTLKQTDTHDAEEFMLPWVSAIDFDSLSLIDMNIFDGDHIEDIIGRKKRRLKKLELRNCRLRTDGDWKVALAYISKIKTLKYLKLDEPSVKYNWRKFFDFQFGYDKKKNSKYEGAVHAQLSCDLRAYKRSDQSTYRVNLPYVSAEESGDEVNCDLSD